MPPGLAKNAGAVVGGVDTEEADVLGPSFERNGLRMGRREEEKQQYLQLRGVGAPRQGGPFHGHTHSTRASLLTGSPRGMGHPSELMCSVPVSGEKRPAGHSPRWSPSLTGTGVQASREK